MQELSEKVDLSKRVLGVDINSPIFANVLGELNAQIVEVIKKVYDGEFASGDISLKFTLSIPSYIKEFPAVNEVGEDIVKEYKYKALHFKHDITTTLKKVGKTKGEYYGEKELKQNDDGEFVEVPVTNPQIGLFDE